MKVSLGFRKPSSRSFGLEMSAPEALLTSEHLTDNQPSGRLLAFLSASFRDGEAAADAFLNSGGSLIVRTREGFGPARVAWTMNEGKVALALSGAKKGAKVEVKMLIEEATWT